MALHFASLGAKVFVIGRREEPLKETCEEIRKAGGTAAYATCDVRDFAAVEAAADKADAEWRTERLNGDPHGSAPAYPRPLGRAHQ